MPRICSFRLESLTFDHCVLHSVPTVRHLLNCALSTTYHPVSSHASSHQHLMISRSPLRPSTSLFKNGACIFCQRSLLVRNKYTSAPAPSTQAKYGARKPYYKRRTSDEVVAQQLGKSYVGKDQKNRPRMPPEILVQAHKGGRLRMEPRAAEHIMHNFESIMKDSSAADMLIQMCTSKNNYAS